MSCQATAAFIASTPPPRRGARAARAARAAPCRWEGRTAARSRPPAPRPAPARGPRRRSAARGRRPRTSAARRARRRACPRRPCGRGAATSSSQSASQTQETSRPSAMLSLRTPEHVEALALQRDGAQDLVGARGVLDQQQRRVAGRASRSQRLRAAERGRHGLPGPATISASDAPSTPHSAAAASAL